MLFTGVVGTTTPPGSLLVSSANNLTTNAITVSGNCTFYTNGLTLGGVLKATGNLYLYTVAGIQSIGLGNGVGTLSISNANLANIQKAATITIGKSGIQSGTITAKGASFFSTVASLTTVTLNSNVGPGPSS